MNHHAPEQQETIERYMLHSLPLSERRAFQEHYFSCDECFEQVQTTARFIAGVRIEARSGVLTGETIQARGVAASLFGFNRLRMAFAFSFAASLLLGIGLLWVWFGQIPALRQEIARERQSREEAEQAKQQSLEAARARVEDTERQLELERSERSKLTGELQTQTQASDTSARRTTEERLIARADDKVQPNVPIVTLEATRDAQSTESQVVVPADAKNVLLWIPVEPGNRFESFRVRILTKGARVVETVVGAKPNRYGALTVSVPASRLQAGKYVVKLFGQRGRAAQQDELLAEYDLRVVEK